MVEEEFVFVSERGQPCGEELLVMDECLGNVVMTRFFDMEIV
jgi:hypothetical protein